MKKTLVLLLVLAMSALAFGDDEKKDTKDTNKAEDRIQAAATVLDEIESAPDTGIPEEVLGSAECVAVVPSLLKGGFIVAANYGRGVASCRTTKGWSAPAFFMVSGGSVGFQIGGQAVDLVMLIMNQDGMKNLLSSQFKLGADASVAAGPVGRQAAGGTRWKNEGAGCELFPRSRTVRWTRIKWRCHRPGQGCHPRVLRPHGAFQNVAHRDHRAAQERVSVPEHLGQVGQKCGRCQIGANRRK